MARKRKEKDSGPWRTLERIVRVLGPVVTAVAAVVSMIRK